MWGIKMASDKKMLQAEPPPHTNTCRISLAPTPPGQGMRVRQTELVAPFLALKLPLIIMGEGVEMGLGQDKAGERTETDLGTQDPLDPSPD